MVTIVRKNRVITIKELYLTLARTIEIQNIRN